MPRTPTTPHPGRIRELETTSGNLHRGFKQREDALTVSVSAAEREAGEERRR